MFLCEAFHYNVSVLEEDESNEEINEFVASWLVDGNRLWQSKSRS